MSPRRRWAIALLVLMAIGYAIVAVVAVTSGFNSLMTGDPVLSGIAGFTAAAAPAFLAVGLIVALTRGAPRGVTIVLFAAWYVVAIGAMLLVHPYWGLAMALDGAIPLLLVLPELRSGMQVA